MPKKNKAQKEIWHGEDDEEDTKLAEEISKLSTNDDTEGDGRKPKKKVMVVALTHFWSSKDRFIIPLI